MSAEDEQNGQLDTGYPHTLRPELHKALTDRGIDYWVTQGITFWNRDDGCECLAYGYKVDGVPKLAIKIVGFTDPEQAIAATLGDAKPTQAESSGTCEMEYVSDWMSWHCKACDQMDMAPRNPKPRYCKWCGRKVVG